MHVNGSNFDDQLMCTWHQNMDAHTPFVQSHVEIKRILIRFYASERVHKSHYSTNVILLREIDHSKWASHKIPTIRSAHTHRQSENEREKKYKQ